jgi:hypothetical protein
VSQRFTDFPEVLASHIMRAIIALMMEAAARLHGATTQKTAIFASCLHLVVLLLLVYCKKYLSVDVAVLGSDAMLTCRGVPAFRRNILSPSSALMREAVYFSETSACSKNTAWHNPENHNLSLHRRGNFKYSKLLLQLYIRCYNENIVVNKKKAFKKWKNFLHSTVKTFSQYYKKYGSCLFRSHASFWGEILRDVLNSEKIWSIWKNY